MSKIDIKIDEVFKYVFGNENDPESKHLLQYVLQEYLEKEITQLQIISNENRTGYLKEKESVMDLNCIFNDGEIANVEMQMYIKNKEDMKQRLTYYNTQLLQSQPIKGKEYSELQNTYVILFCNENLFEDGKLYRRFLFRDEDGVILNHLQQIIIVELNKVQNRLYEGEKWKERTKRERLNYYFRYCSDTSKQGIIKKIVENDKEVELMEEKINRISEEQIARIREIMKEKSEDYVNNPKKLKEMYIQRGLEQGLEQGLKKGLKKGLNEGLERGRNEGLKKGIEQEKAKQKSMILAMHEKLSIKEMAELLHMKEAEIEELLHS